MSFLDDFRVCRACLIPDSQTTFTSLYNEPQSLNMFEAIAGFSISVDKNKRAALICDSCLVRLNIAIILRDDIRKAEEILNSMGQEKGFEVVELKNEEIEEIQLKSEVEEGEYEIVDQTFAVNSDSAPGVDSIQPTRELFVRLERLEDNQALLMHCQVGDESKISEKNAETVQDDDLKKSATAGSSKSILDEAQTKLESDQAITSKSSNEDRNKSVQKLREKMLEDKNHLGSHKRQVSKPSEMMTNNQMTLEVPQNSTKCQICQKSHWSKSHLKRHIETVHQKLKKFVCKVCGFKFGQKGSLKQHIKAVHEKIKNFKCDLCDFISSTKINLQRHIACHVKNPNFKPRTHDTSNQNRPFKCSVENCGKFFKCRSDLKKHKKAHSDARPFVCTICKNGFKTNQALNRHQSGVHRKKV